MTETVITSYQANDEGETIDMSNPPSGGSAARPCVPPVGAIAKLENAALGLSRSTNDFCEIAEARLIDGAYLWGAEHLDNLAPMVKRLRAMQIDLYRLVF